MIHNTTGAPKMAVTVLMLSSVGAIHFLASRSQNRQNTLPPKKHAGIMSNGFVVPNNFRISCGTAIPTKEMGPANATMHAESTLDNTTSRIRNVRMFTPRFCAYVSPSW
jgi:hypothetical protein